MIAAALAALLGCGRAPSLIVVRETGDLRQVCRVGGDCFVDGAFPGPVHGDKLLIVRAADPPEGHVEQLGLWDGSLRWLTPPGPRVREPAWTPNGQAVVFESGWTSFSDLHVVGLDGAPPRLLTTHPAGSFEPDVHPDGARVVFATSRDGDVELYEVPLSGGEPVRRTTAPGEDTAPAWSPDGRWLAWKAQRGDAVRVWLAPADAGAGAPLLPDGPEEHRDLAWSPDGRHLAVIAAAPGQPDRLLVVAVDGRRVAADLSAPASLQHPAWSPDGRQLAVTASGRDGARVLAAAWASGGLEDRGPGWLPRWSSR